MDPRFDPLFVSLSPWDDPAAWLAVAQQFQRSFTMEFVFYAVGVLLLWLGLHVLLRRRLAHRSTFSTSGSSVSRGTRNWRWAPSAPAASAC